MNDSTTRKTLSLKKKAPAARTDTGAEPRKRSGARARQAALQELARQPRDEHPARPPRRATPDAPTPPARRETPARQAGHTAATDMPRIQRQPRTPRQPRRAELFAVFAPCPHGLEEALTLELQALGYEGVRAGRAGCHFQADWAGVLRA